MNYLITLMFAVSTVMFVALAIQNAILWYMYNYGYLKIKNSHIINALVNLFLWKTLAFIDLTFVAFSGFVENRDWSLIFRGIGIIPFGMTLYWLIQFGRWSIDKDGGDKNE